MAAKKNSLVGNINKRKRAGKSRPKSRSTISKGSYREMQEGWPHSAKKRAAKKKSAKSSKKRAKKSAPKRKSAKRSARR